MSSCAKKETVDINIFVTSRNGDRKTMQSIRMKSRPSSRIKKLDQFRWASTKVITIEKTLSWLHFNDEPRVQERQQVKDRQSCIFVFVVHLTIPDFRVSTTIMFFHRNFPQVVQVQLWTLATNQWTVCKTKHMSKKFSVNFLAYNKFKSMKKKITFDVKIKVFNIYYFLLPKI